MSEKGQGGAEPYYYAGPVAKAYENDFGKRLTFIAGPTGGGKTFASLRKYQKAALIQHPSHRDGVRRAKIGCLGPSYPILHRTVIASYKRMYPEGRGSHYSGSDNRQLSHVFRGENRGGKFEIQADFMAIQDLNYDEFFRGTEYTGFHLPEADTNDALDVIAYSQNRVGRFGLEHVPPGKSLAWKGLFGDSNTPVIGSWFHELFYLQLDQGDDIAAEKRVTDDRRLYKQPAGYDPRAPDGWGRGAENRTFLMRSDPFFYRDQARSMGGDDEPKVKRLLMCIPQSDMFGQPVQVSFNADVHCTSMIMTPDPLARVVIGVDTGLTPGIVFMQKTAFGQWRVFREIAPITGQMDLVMVGQQIKQILNETFKGAPGGAVIFCDPAGRAKLRSNMSLTEIQVLQQASGVPVLPAPSNEPAVRISAVERVMKPLPYSDSSGRIYRGILISRIGCPNLVRALGGGYSYKKRHGEIKPEIDKGKLSHIAEALQYGVLGADGINGQGGRFTVSGTAKPKSKLKVTNSYGNRL